MNYRGRFAPSPTGPLHAGSIVAALASWLDARANGGCWLVRIEDVDAPRCIAGVDRLILGQLAACSLVPDEPAWRQSLRSDAYAAALHRLMVHGEVFRCTCSRQQIASHWHRLGRRRAKNEESPYPGTCRNRQVVDARAAGSMRLRCGTDESPVVVDWLDRRLGRQRQDVTRSCGDFVVQRSDGLWAYQLAVVVDDAAQGISDVVRGEDLVANTARQIHLQKLLGLSRPRYLHTPLVLSEDGAKLSKQNGARAIDTSQPLQVLRAAGQILGVRSHAARPTDWLADAVRQWSIIYPLPTPPVAHHRQWCLGAGTKPIGCGVDPSLERHAMITTPSGLQYHDAVVGDGAEATVGQKVQVHYTGWLYEDGKRSDKFDSSKDRGSPFSFKLGSGMVIGGWDEGVQGMKVGGTRTLIIPPELGYGERGAGGAIPPNATLEFEVDLLGV